LGSTGCVRVVAGSRLHAGFHTVREAGVVLGGAGFYSSEPRLVLEARRVEGPGVRVLGGPLASVVERALARLGASGVEARLVEEPPRHVGLGSTTQASLAAAAAWRALQGGPVEREWLVDVGLHVLGRQAGSTVGTILFAYGGFAVGPGVPAPRGARGTVLPLPGDWRLLIVRPHLPRGPGEEEEARAIGAPPEPPGEARRLMERGLRLLLLGVARGDLDVALEGLRSMQWGTGMTFSRLQGGVYRGDIAAVAAEAARDGMFLAQSSWGPTLYTLTRASWAESDAKTLRMILSEVGVPGNVIVAEPANGGARVEACEDKLMTV